MSNLNINAMVFQCSLCVAGYCFFGLFGLGIGALIIALVHVISAFSV